MIIITCSKLNIMIGSVKTSVFPEPVKAIPIMSLPLSLKKEEEKNSLKSCSLPFSVALLFILILQQIVKFMAKQD